MQKFIGNNGSEIVIADTNTITSSGHTYWLAGRASTLFIGESLYNAARAKSTSPIQPTYYNAAQTDDNLRDRFDNEWYWILGDCRHGGFAVYYNNTDRYEYIWCAVDPENHTGTFMTTGTAVMKGVNFYLVDYCYNDGENRYNQIGMIYSDNNGKFRYGYYSVAILPPPTPGFTVTAVQENIADGLLIGNGNPVIYPNKPSATVVPAVSGNIDGFSFNPGGESVFSITVSGWMTVNRFGNFPYLANILNDIPGDDPNDPGGYSAPGGGYGIPQYSIDVDFPELPPDLLINSGAIKIYSPLVTDMMSFMNYIYSSADAIITNFKKLWANPLESIISLGTLPFILPTDGDESVKFCGVDSGILMPKVSTQYQVIDCGTLEINGEYASYLDYNSFTRLKMFLPFIGIVDLSDDCMDSTLHLKYYIDILTGECLAILKVTKRFSVVQRSITGDESTLAQYNSCLYTYKGNVLSECPLSGNNFQNLYSGVINLVQAAALPSPASFATIANTLNTEKSNVQRAGNLTGNSGALGEYVPYVIIEKPMKSVPIGNEIYNAYPANMTYTIGELKKSGYTVAVPDTLRVENIEGATDVEKEMIKSLFESGVIL